MSQPCPEALDFRPSRGPYTGICGISEQRGHGGQSAAQQLAFAMKAVSPALPPVGGTNVDPRPVALSLLLKPNQSKLRPCEVCWFCTPQAKYCVILSSAANSAIHMPVKQVPRSHHQLLPAPKTAQCRSTSSTGRHRGTSWVLDLIREPSCPEACILLSSTSL